jgi:hypothetical protein
LFFGAFLITFQRIQISVKFFFEKKNNLVILALFKNFEAKRAKNGSKNQKTYLVNMS